MRQVAGKAGRLHMPLIPGPAHISMVSLEHPAQWFSVFVNHRVRIYAIYGSRQELQRFLAVGWPTSAIFSHVPVSTVIAVSVPSDTSTSTRDVPWKTMSLWVYIREPQCHPKLRSFWWQKGICHGYDELHRMVTAIPLLMIYASSLISMSYHNDISWSMISNWWLHSWSMHNQTNCQFSTITYIHSHTKCWSINTWQLMVGPYQLTPWLDGKLPVTLWSWWWFIDLSTV